MSTREELDIEICRLEIQRLTKCLEAANLQAEYFERLWYLRGDTIEDALEALQDHLRIKDKNILQLTKERDYNLDPRLRQIDGKREWVGLTDEEIEEALPGLRWIDAVDTYHVIEAKLKEKNT